MKKERQWVGLDGFKLVLKALGVDYDDGLKEKKLCPSCKRKVSSESRSCQYCGQNLLDENEI